MKKFLLLILIMGLFTVFTFGGIEWTATTKTVGKGKRANNHIDIHAYAQGGDVKYVFEGVSNENPFHSQNGYWLYKAKEGTIYVVNDNKKTYMIMELDSLLQMVGMFGQLVKITVSDHTIDSEELPSETLLGYKCNHLKITSEYKMKMKITFIKKTMRIHEVKEIWGSTSVPGINEISQAFLNKDLKTGIEDLDEMISEQMEKQKKIGFPMKTITHQTQKNKKGKVKSKSTTTMTVTKIESKNFPKAFFEVPAEYDEIQMPGKGLKGMFGK
ncbi:MAG: DUF4412 domain-containing protein [bacterium]|nr:DUF4412 domain-containing protein [bacterium]